MSQIHMEPCKCSKCGNEQSYDWVISWNSCCLIDPINKCYRCGNELAFDDIIQEKVSDFYKNTMIVQKVYAKINTLDKKPREQFCIKCGSSNTYGSSVSDIGNKEYDENNIHCTKDILCCKDCEHEENVMDIQNYEEIGLKFIGMNEEGYYLFKETEKYKTIMENYSRESAIEFERVKQEMITNEELIGLI